MTPGPNAENYGPIAFAEFLLDRMHERSAISGKIISNTEIEFREDSSNPVRIVAPAAGGLFRALLARLAVRCSADRSPPPLYGGTLRTMITRGELTDEVTIEFQNSPSGWLRLSRADSNQDGRPANE